MPSLLSADAFSHATIFDDAASLSRQEFSPRCQLRRQKPRFTQYFSVFSARRCDRLRRRFHLMPSFMVPLAAFESAAFRKGQALLRRRQRPRFSSPFAPAMPPPGQALIRFQAEGPNRFALLHFHCRIRR